MKRREFLKIGGTGLTAITLGQALAPRMFGSVAAASMSSPLTNVDGVVQLTMEEAMFEMPDTVQVYSWAYRNPDHGLRIPGPVLFVNEGDLVRIDVTNNFPAGHGGTHSFEIPGVVKSDPIPVGQTAHLEFLAPPAGTYLYFDPENRPVNRVMGLHGLLVVHPRGGNTPYSNPTPALQSLFDHLGSPGWAPGKGSEQFPGHPWDPQRAWIWLFGTVDPALCAQVQANPNLSGSTFTANFMPDYFLVNGRGGFFASHGHDIGPSGNVGQPALIRCVNAGMPIHSSHIHGNHVYLLSASNSFGNPDLTVPDFTRDDGLPRNGGLYDNVTWVDTWTMAPGDRKDLLLPFVLPPDIPRDPEKHVVSSVLSTAERMARGGNATPWPPVEEPFPLVYPMHCHNELSQTLVGGNYPQGLVIHWQIDGDVDMRYRRDDRGENRRQELEVVPGLDGVIQVLRAEARIKLGRLLVAGIYSGAPGTVLEIFAGPDFTPVNKLGETVVAGNGTWSFRGRALKVLASRSVSVRVAEGSARPAVPVALR